MTIAAGTRLGPYEILSPLGAGGMGEVYRARDSRLQREVAVKLLPDSGQSPEGVRRFRQEASAVAALSHPNILAIYDVGEHEGSPYIVTELLEGETLRDMLNRGPSPLPEVLGVALQAARGLAAAHQRGFVHRDIKPENLFLTRDGVVKILDFGLAKPVRLAVAEHGDSDLPTAPLVTESGIVMGTIGYISPEQLRGQPVDARSDLFALGCVFYELFTGNAAFHRSSGAETIAAILKEDPAPMASSGRPIPPDVESLVRRCLEKEPDGRLASARQLVEELEVVQDRQRLLSSQERLSAGGVLSWTGQPVAATPARAGLRAFLMKTPVRIGLLFLALAVAGAAFWWAGWGRFSSRKGAVKGPGEPKTIVILPFDNLGAADEAYFSDGIAKEITARLYEIPGLGVIDPSSAVQYRGGKKPLRQVAKELRVDYVLQGSVRWQKGEGGGDKVRVTPQLVRASDEVVLWAHSYEREMKDIFDVQSDIARSVVAALNLALGPAGAMNLDSRPTSNMQAYDLYLRGLAFFTGSTSEENSRLALQMFEKAAQLDPNFALAWALGSRLHSRMYNSYFDRSARRLALADETSKRALAIAPDLPEALIARGLYYYWGHREYAKALEQFDKVLATRPDHAGALELRAYILRRQGRFEEALSMLEKVYPLNPRAGILAKEMGTTAMLLRRYGEAKRHFEEALSVSPDMAETYCLAAQLALVEKGDRNEALSVLDSAIDMGIKDDDVLAFSALLLAQEGRAQEALRRLDQSPLQAFSGLDNYEPRAMVRARVLELAGRKAEARAEYAQALKALENLIRGDPEDARFRSALGLTLASLGEGERAIAEGKRAVELLPISKDALEGPPRVYDLARIHAALGQPQEAWKYVKPLMAIPAWPTPALLKSDPVWDQVTALPECRRRFSPP